MISQTRFARPAVMIASVALVAAANLGLIPTGIGRPAYSSPPELVGTPCAAIYNLKPAIRDGVARAAAASLPCPSPVAPLAIAARDQLSPRSAARHRAFYAQQMASEAALERWSLSLPGPARADLPEAPRPLTAGMQLR